MSGRLSVRDLLTLRKQHVRPNRRPHREKQGKQAEAVEILLSRSSKVAIEERVCSRIAPEMHQVHQRKRKIVKDIRRGDDRIEFDGVEQQRLAVHQRNVGQMEIAVTAPDETLPGAPAKQDSVGRDMTVAAGVEPIDHGDVKAAFRAEFCRVAVDDRGDGAEPVFAVGARRFVVGLQNRIRKGGRQRRLDRSRRSDAIECLLFVEAHHFDRPLDREAASADFEGAVVSPRDCDHPPVELRRIACIDSQLFFAGAPAFLECRVVEKRQPYGALDLQGKIVAEEDHRGMGVDPPAAFSGAKPGAIEKIENPTLTVGFGSCGRIGGPLERHGRNTAAPVICPDRNFDSTSLASRNGETVVCVLMPACAAILKNSMPSLRVRLATDRSWRSPQRIS